MKVEFGADNTQTKVTTAVGLPVVGQTGDVLAGVAEDAALAGNLLRMGVRASAVRPTAMSADGDMVDIAADRSGQLHVNPGRCATATLANVNDAATSTALAASNTARTGLIIFNDSPSYLYVNYGATASTTAFTYKLDPYGTLEMGSPVFTGAVNGIWSADASGAARVSELSA